jgi:hypothetical protein
MEINDFYKITENVCKELDLEIAVKGTITFGNPTPYQRIIIRQTNSRKYYGTIRVCNRVIEKSDEVKVKDLIYSECFKFIFDSECFTFTFE